MFGRLGLNVHFNSVWLGISVNLNAIPLWQNNTKTNGDKEDYKFNAPGNI